MRKKFVYLALVPVFLLGCVACNDEEIPSTPKEEEPSEYMLVENGKTDYCIVLPTGADANEEFAAQELTEFFYRATGITLETVYDTGLTYSKSSRYLSIGETVPSLYAGVAVSKEQVGEQGFVLQTVDASCFMLGSESIGSLYATYEFLSREFGFECYAESEIALETGVSNKALLSFSTVEKPDITYRSTGYTAMMTGDYATRCRMNYGTGMLSPSGSNAHNAMDYLAPSKFESEHPDWYDEGSANNALAFRQLCYTAHGDSAELALMREEVLKKMKTVSRTNEALDVISFTQGDTDAWCSCQACQKVIDENGNSKISTLIAFLNPIAKELAEWSSSVYSDRNLKILIFSYGMATIAPPAVYDDDLKKYVPITEEVALADNIVVWYAPIGAKYYEDFDADANTNYYEWLKMWSDLCAEGNLYLWSYSTNFGNYLLFYDSFASMSGNYKLFKKYGVDYIFDQSQYQDEVCTGFATLKAYLNAKLVWNVDEDYEGLISDFFDNYFRDASVPMKELFDGMRQHYATLYADGKVNGALNNSSSLSSSCYSQKTLEGWLAKIDEAYRCIEPLAAEDRELYEEIYRRINLESVSLRYMYVSIYTSKLGDSLSSFRSLLITDINSLGLRMWNEGANVERLFESW